MSLLAVPASAAEVQQNIYIDWTERYTSDNTHQFIVNSPTSGVSSSLYDFGGNQTKSYWFQNIWPSNRNAAYSSSVTLYISYYWGFGSGSFTATTQSNPALSSSDFRGYYRTDTGADEDAKVSVSSWKPNVTTPASTGYTLSVRAPGSEGVNVGLPGIEFLSTSKRYSVKVISGGSNAKVGLFVTSARYITTETTADSEALENMADQIAQQNEMMQAFYGDIIAILQAMDTKLGSLEAAAELMNQYLTQVITALGSINGTVSNIYSLLGTYLHYLEDIAKTAEDIKTELASFHTDFLTYIQLLISTISSESDDIQAKMEEIYSLLIAYLNNAFGSAVTPDATEGIEGADNQLDAIEGIESDYTGSLSDKWDSINIADFTLAPGLLSGVAWVSSWWTNFFEATGDFKVVLIMGLFFGVCGLLIGMISRASRRAGGGEDDA